MRAEMASHGELSVPSKRPFDTLEVGALISNLVLEGAARCPDDETYLETLVDREVVSFRCPCCGARGSWWCG